jgi:hypothetical protein
MKNSKSNTKISVATIFFEASIAILDERPLNSVYSQKFFENINVSARI